jgi:hypothetical protein
MVIVETSVFTEQIQGMVHMTEAVLYKLFAIVIPSGVFGARNLST